MSQPEPDNLQEDFASIWEQLSRSYDYVAPKRGDVREGVVLSVRPGEIMVDIGAKQDAIVASRELQQMSPEELQALNVGDGLHVYVVHIDKHSGSPIVSLRLAREYEHWQRAQELMDSGEIIKATVTDYNKGGLLCFFESLQGFVPASQVIGLARRYPRESQDDTLASFVGRELALKVIEVNRRRRRLILSERAAGREWRAQQREQFLAEIKEGEIRVGTVSNLVVFGAFVDLGGIDGLIHLSQLSWGRVEHPRDVLEIGQSVDVFVLNVDRERQRIGLSLKHMQPDPWEMVGDKYEAGQLVTGTVTHLVKFGAFVELEPGVEGLIHLSELAEGDFGDSSNVVSEGEELSLLILSVDVEHHRISLSLTQVPKSPDVDEEKEPTEEDGASADESVQNIEQ